MKKFEGKENFEETICYIWTNKYKEHTNRKIEQRTQFMKIKKKEKKREVSDQLSQEKILSFTGKFSRT